MADKTDKTAPADLDAKLTTLTDAVAKLAAVVATQAQAPAQEGVDVEAMTKVMASGIAEANQKSRQWWDELAFPDKSALNPLGEKDHPRPELRRGVWWVGFHLSKNEHTADEIELLNQLRPGKFPMTDDLGRVVQPDFFEVVARDPRYPDGDIQVTFPCKEEKDRLALARFDRGRGMVDLLKQMLPKATEAAPVQG